MPKKTKKQKILAKLHRKIHTTSYSLNNVKSQNLRQTSITAPFTYNEPILKKNSDTNIQNAETAVYYSYVKNDLIKITIFTTTAVILQLVLYFFLHRV